MPAGKIAAPWAPALRSSADSAVHCSPLRPARHLNQINACVKNDGLLTSVIQIARMLWDEPARCRCKKDESPLSWSITGAA